MYGARQSRQGSENVASTQAKASMYGARQSRKSAENVASTQAKASMYGSDKSAKASMFGASKSAQASMYGADKSLEGIKDTNTTSTRNIRATGDESRKSASQANRFDIDKENRAAARSRAGSRRY